MLIQTAEHVHRREMAHIGRYWPHNALDIAWKAGGNKFRPDVMLRLLDQWRNYATFQRCMPLYGMQMRGYLNVLENEGGRGMVLDRITVAATVAMSLAYQLRTLYAGSAIRVQRSNDANQTDIGFVAGFLDTASLATHAGANSEGVVTAYDQGPLVQDFVATTSRPTITLSGTLQTSAGGKPTATYNGSTSNLSHNVASPLGMANTSPALSVCMVVKWTSTTGTYCFSLGAGSTGQSWRAGAFSSTEAMVDNTPGTDRRVLGPGSSVTSADRYYVFGRPASGTVSQYAARQNSVDLPESALTGGSATLSLANGPTRWGCVSNSSGNAAGFMNGRSNFLAVFPFVLSGHNLAQIEGEMARHL